eukprot:GHVL01040343.1.p1 GENE.GHVL01040343.1~~GHVL01040343.1.p1  ORF type:complete len:509 (-),score=84.97 GHVL01040343.1:824-2317(-)
MELLLKVVLVTCINSFILGFNLAVSKYVADDPLIDKIFYLGASIGCLFCVFYSSNKGHRQLLIFSNLLILAAVTVSINARLLIFSRFITGFGVGLITVLVPLYISQVCPSNLRGFYGVFHNILLNFGIVTAVSLSFLYPTSNPPPGIINEPMGVQIIEPIVIEDDPVNRSMILWIIQGFICILSIFLMIKYDDETPFYYISQSDDLSANKTLVRLHNISSIDATALLRQMKYNGCFNDEMCSETLNPALWIGMVLVILNQLTGYNQIFVNPGVLESITSQGGFSFTVAPFISLIIGLMNFICCIISSILVETVGRRLLFIYGVSGQIISLIPVTVSILFYPTNSLLVASMSITSIAGFIICFSLGGGAILTVYISEMFPPRIAKTATGIIWSFYWISAMIDIPPDFTFILSCLSLIFIWMFIFETKGYPPGVTPYYKRFGIEISKDQQIRFRQPITNSPGGGVREVSPGGGGSLNIPPHTPLWPTIGSENGQDYGIM